MRKRKIRRLILPCILLILAVATILFYQNAWGFDRQVSEGEKTLRLEVVHTAESWLGAKEADGSHRQIIDVYNSVTPLPRDYAVTYEDAWCATFDSAVAIRCGLTDIIPRECSCEEQIELFRDVHATLMGERWTKTDGCTRLYVHYTLKSGREVVRYYIIDEHTAAYDTLQMYFSDYRYLFNCNSWDSLSNGSFTSLTVNYFDDYADGEYTAPAAMEMNAVDVEDREKIAQFMEALRKDCEAGNMAQPYTFHVAEDTVAWCYLSTTIRNEQGIITSNGERFRELTIYPSAAYTTALLEQWLMEYYAS